MWWKNVHKGGVGAHGIGYSGSDAGICVFIRSVDMDKYGNTDP